MTDQNYEQLRKDVDEIRSFLGKLIFPLDPQTKGGIENTVFATLKANIFKGGLPVFTSARDTTVDPPTEGDHWIEDVSSVRSICFFRNNVKYCTPAAPAYVEYSPTRSAETNLDSNITFASCKYIQIGNMVVVSGRFTADPTAGAATSFEMTLPVASNLGAEGDVNGVAFCGGIAGQGAEVVGSAANNTAKVQWVAVDVTSKTWSFVFMYQII